MDIAFLQSMIPHAQQTLAMCSQAPAHAQSGDVRALADHLDQARSDDIDRMSSILIATGQPRPPMGEAGPLATAGYFDEPQLVRLAAAGARFDHDFLQMMLEHEQGALLLAQSEVSHGHAPSVTALAASMVSSLHGEDLALRTALSRSP